MSSKRKVRWLVLTVVAATLCRPAMAADERKLVNEVRPAYPDIVRRMHVKGTVRVEVVIAADGTVKTVRPLGGHPVLIEAATAAVRKWRYAPGPEVTTVVVFHFHDE